MISCQCVCPSNAGIPFYYVEGVASSFVQVEPVQAGGRFPVSSGPWKRVCTSSPSSLSVAKALPWLERAAQPFALIEGNSQCELANRGFRVPTLSRFGCGEQPGSFVVLHPRRMRGEVLRGW